MTSAASRAAWQDRSRFSRFAICGVAIAMVLASASIGAWAADQRSYSGDFDIFQKTALEALFWAIPAGIAAYLVCISLGWQVWRFTNEFLSGREIRDKLRIAMAAVVVAVVVGVSNGVLGVIALSLHSKIVGASLIFSAVLGTPFALAFWSLIAVYWFRD